MNKPKRIQHVLFVIMKITLVQIFLMTFLITFVLANSKGQGILERKVSVNVKNQEIKSILKEIELQASLQFTYRAKLVNASRKVSLNAIDVTIGEILEMLFSPSVGYSVINEEEEILLSPFLTNKPIENSQPTTAVLYTVSGIVKDGETGMGLPGANIMEKGTSNGVVTDSDGKYVINVSDNNSVLIFSFVGFATQEVAVNSRAIIDISLSVDIESLSEIVVIGYGTQERKDVSSSISSVKGQDIQAMAVTGLDQAMQGKMAGVNISSNDATPGGSTKVTVRGIGSLNNTDPLYVIDGVMSRQGLTNIVPTDIESIDVLKDASATAIYGLQGAAGVVIVTTKRGKGGKPRLTFDAYSGVSRVNRKIKLLSPEQYAAYNTELFNNTNAWRTSTGRTDLLPLNPEWTNPSPSGTDWQDEVFRSARMDDYQLGLSGGNDKSNYSISLGYRNHEGVVPRSEYKRYNTRINIDHRAMEFLKVGASFSYTFNRTRGVDTNNLGGGVIQYTMTYSPLLPVYQPGYPGQYSTIPSESLNPDNKYWYAFVANPFSVFDYSDKKNDATNLYASMYAEVKLPLGVTYKSQFGLYTYDGDSYSWTRRIDTPWDPNGANRGRVQNGLSVGNWGGYGYNWDNTLNYEKQIGEHNINLTTGVVAQLEHSNAGSTISQSNFVSEDVRQLGFGDPNSTVATQARESEVTLVGVLGRLLYSYRDKYLLTANMRRDQSSRFASSLNTAVFPSASVAWRMSEESFMAFTPFISDLKLRAGWGKIGNQNGISAYPTFNLLNSGSDYTIDGQLVSGVAVSALGNKIITWEETKTSNIGLDVSVFDGTITLTADYYIKDNDKILYNVPIGATGGVGIYPSFVPPPAQNAARIKNSGLEFFISYRKQIKNFSLSVSGNGTFNKNEILSLGGNKFILPPNIVNQIGDYVSRFQVGQSIGAFYGYQVEGIFQNQAEVDAANEKAKQLDPNIFYQEQFTAPGDYKYKDVNNDGRINEADRTFIGNPNPKFTYGFSFNASYKNLDLTAFFQGVAGVDVFNALAFRTEGSYGQVFNRTQRSFEERWTGEGTSNTYPRIIYDDPNNNTRVSSRYVDNGAYMRLRNLQIGYSIPKSLLSKLRLERLRFYVAGQNLLTFTKYNGLDPESGVGQREGNSNTNYDLNIDRGQYPQSRTIMIGLNASL
jgi:TonB-linked SusC/RagA family outer membrane protein